MNELIIWNDKSALAQLSTQALQIKVALLESAASISCVESEMDKDVAVQEMKSLKAHISAVEDQRVALVRPQLDKNNSINEASKAYVLELKGHYERLSSLTGLFIAQQRRDAEVAESKRRAAAQALADEADRIEREKLAAAAKLVADQQKLEREKQEAIVKARNDHERAKADEDFKVQQAALQIQKEKQQQETLRQQQELALKAPPAEVVKAPAAKPEGMVERGDWVMVVRDMGAFSRAFPHLVRMELNKEEANKAMKAGLREAPGADIRFVIKVDTRK